MGILPSKEFYQGYIVMAMTGSSQASSFLNLKHSVGLHFLLSNKIKCNKEGSINAGLTNSASVYLTSVVNIRTGL